MTKYKHISQKRYCCVPACIQMILQRRGMPKVGPQVAIARELGGDPQNKIGCYINSKKYSLASFFRRCGCALDVVRYPIENFKSEK